MAISRRNFLLGSGAGILAAPGIAGLTVGEQGVEADTDRGDSLWTTEIPPLDAQPVFHGERAVDLAIIGGGYTGLSCAYYAKKFRPDWNIVVLDSQRIGSGASSRNSGAVYARYVGMDDIEMPKRGLNRLREFIDTEEIDCDFSPAPTLTLHRSQEAAQKAKNALGKGQRWLSQQELNESAGTNYYAGAVESPDFYKIQPAKLVIGKAKAVLRQGVELFEYSPVLNIQHGKPAVLNLPTGRITAKNVCVATNAYTPRMDGMFDYKMWPIHQYSYATGKLSDEQIKSLGLDKWNMRFEPNILPVTYSLTPSGHFFMRMVLGYESHNSSEWKDIEGAKQLAKKLFTQRYPQIADIGLEHGWHGVTGHTALMQHMAGPIGDGNVHASVAYNGLGIMPSHNNGYLTACRMTGKHDQDLGVLSGVNSQLPLPGGFYRSLMLQPAMNLLTPV